MGNSESRSQFYPLLIMIAQKPEQEETGLIKISIKHSTKQSGLANYCI